MGILILFLVSMIAIGVGKMMQNPHPPTAIVPTHQTTQQTYIHNLTLVQNNHENPSYYYVTVSR